MASSIEEVGREYTELPSDKKDSNLSKLWDILLKSGIATELSVKLVQLCRTSFHITSLDKLITLVSDSTDIPAIRSLLKKIKSKEINDICEPICNGKHDSTTKSQVIECLGKTKQNIADGMIKRAAITSTVLIAIQITKLFFVWHDIKSAKNIADESKKLLPIISNKIAEVSNGIGDITQIIDRYNSSQNEGQKSRFAMSVNRKIGGLFSTYAETILLLSDVKVKIGNSIERIALRQKDQIFDGISNFVNFVTSVVQIASVDGCVSQGIAIFHRLTTCGYLALCMTNLAFYEISTKTLADLRKNMDEVLKFERELFEIRKILNGINNWLDQIENDDSSGCVPCKGHPSNVRCFKCINSNKDGKQIIKLRNDANVYGFK